MGCDLIHEKSFKALVISIHAPAWGATLVSATPSKRPIFQSTHPRGVRQIIPSLFVHNFMISIHAPAWGATFSTAAQNIFLLQISIHAPAWGATAVRILALIGILFQSTHPRGVRLSISSIILRFAYFNPRTRVGCDYFRYPSSLSVP